MLTSALRWLPALALLVTVSTNAAVPDEIEFNQHIRPILSNNCFACHGPDVEGNPSKLRLDIREEAIAKVPEKDYIADGLRFGISASLVQLSGLFLVHAPVLNSFRGQQVAARRRE